MNTRRWIGLGLLALALIALPFLTAAQGDSPRISVPTPDRDLMAEGIFKVNYPPRLDADLNEPNDDPSTATWISYNDYRNGLIDPPGDVDYFAFYGFAGDVIVADIDASEAGSPLDSTLTLYDRDGVTPLAFNDDGDPDLDPRVSYTLPEEGWYFLAVEAFGHPDGAGGEDYFYWLFLTVADVYEPNNRISRSTLTAIGDEILANISPSGDVDYYRFYGTAGQTLVFDIDAADIGSWLAPRLTLYSVDGYTQLATSSYFDSYRDPLFVYTLPADGPYYLRVEDHYNYAGDPQAFYALRVDFPPLLVSPATSGRVAGIPFAPGDILLHQIGTDHWEMYFDASDVGLKSNLAAFDVLNGGCLLLSFTGKETVPIWGVGTSIQPQDILMFCPTQTGEDTSGDFQWFFDGSDVGLTASGEALDAISFQEEFYTLLLSTKANAVVPGFDRDLKAADEDLLYFSIHRSGSYTVGEWSLYQDGSTVPGLGYEDVTGLWVDADGTRYLTMENSFNVGGVRGDGNDIITVDGDQWNGYAVAPYWRGEDVGLTDRIDGIDLPLSPYPADPYPYP